MQSKIYRFEIVRALANAVFEARDSANGSTLLLYEWTPPTVDRAAARLRLEQLADEVHAEVFSADASLYLATGSPELGREALGILRHHGLFTGVWLNEPPPEPAFQPPSTPTPPTPQFQPVRPPPPPVVTSRKKRRGPRLLGWLLLTFTLLAAGATLGARFWSRTPVCPAPIQNEVPSQTTLKQHRELQGKLQKAEAAAAQNADAVKAFSGVHLLRLKNGCSTPMRVAVAYTGFNRQTIVGGWKAIAPGETAVVAASPSADFRVFATDQLGHTWGSNSPLEVIQADFTYNLGSGMDDASKTQVNTLQVHMQAPGDYMSLNCP